MRISDWSSDVCSSDLRYLFDLGSTEFGGRLDKRRFGAESAKRRFVAGVHHRLSHANQFTGASLILTGKRQTVARRDRGGKLVADRKSTRLNSSHSCAPRMPSSACKKKNTSLKP